MSELRFDGRVAVVTGAGRGLGAAYARLLASRGAQVVVNDTGVSLRGEDSSADAAAEVVEAIRMDGGIAIANTDSVATPEGGSCLVESALEAFGRLDIVIHNAGIVRRAALSEMTPADFDGVLDVHLRGGFHVLRQAFPLMCRAGYGRIVLTGSLVGLYGNIGAANYAAAKGGLHGLSAVAALEGAAHGVISNVILPAAVTRMSEGVDTSAFPPMPPEWVAPLVAYLAHESCAETGELWVSAAGRIARAFMSETPGVRRSDWTIESVASAVSDIRHQTPTLEISPVPNGFAEHLGAAFAMPQDGESN